MSNSKSQIDLNNISIIGVGLIGSSFALALRKHGFKGRITGVGRNRDNLIKAKGLGIIDDYSTTHAEGARDADLILLASPVGYFEQIIRDIRNNIKKGAIVTDVGSVKAGVIKKIVPLIPEGVSFIGGHPIAGKECSGIDAADAAGDADTADLLTEASRIVDKDLWFLQAHLQA